VQTGQDLRFGLSALGCRQRLGQPRPHFGRIGQETFACGRVVGQITFQTDPIVQTTAEKPMSARRSALVLVLLFPLFFIALAAPADEPKCHLVVRVIDGDTIVVKIDGKETKVRLLGVQAAGVGAIRPRP
jgi:hypothetical protein